MKLVSFGEPGRERPGVIVGERLLDVCAAAPDLPGTMRGILEQGMLRRLRELSTAASLFPASVFERADRVRLGPPVTDPSKIICLGLNYRDHAEEQGREVPSTPLVFSKGPNALAGHGDLVPYPRGVTEFDFEVELAFVMGHRAWRLDEEDDAMASVAGYSIFMDLTARDLQRRERQWFRAKSADGSGPFGPYLVTPDEIRDPHALDISLDVDGETMQASNTSHLVFGVDHLVRYLSQTMTLEPGDVIATGTPGGVGVFRTPPRFLRGGERVSARIAGLGELTCTIGEREP
jgi:2-keto-4-pentenoate hydratase/2-oxohepta-3-ene-1,7-dioic acid hydratase in catechol pathway